MPLTREQIKRAPVHSEPWRNNKTQVGGLWFDPRKIQPLSDHILIELDAELETEGAIVKPDVARGQDISTRTGTVIAVGPGKLMEVRQYTESWMLNPLRRKPLTLKVGDRVTIGHYSDWESHHCDFEGRDRNIVLCQEADVRLIESQV
jgi:co-chaperonin GroES (HSP10)